MSKDYIPGSDRLFFDWAKNLYARALALFTALGIPSPQTFLEALLADFEAKLQLALSPNHGKVDIANKNAARKALEAACRSYVQAFLAHNPSLSDAQREELGITVRDKTPTSIPDPTGQAEADVTFPGPHLIELQKIRKLSGGADDSRSDYGVRIYYGLMPPGGASVEQATGKDRLLMKVPTSGTELPHSIFTREKKSLFDFDGFSGMTAFFCLRYENSKGKAGPWGPFLQGIIP
jgi:hypothetical protein